MRFVGPVGAVVPLAQTTEGGGRRAINDRIEGRVVTFIMIGKNVTMVSFPRIFMVLVKAYYLTNPYRKKENLNLHTIVCILSRGKYKERLQQGCLRTCKDTRIKVGFQ